MKGEVRRALVSGTFLLMTARAGALSLGFLQSLILADKFGATHQTDAFFVAYSALLLLVGGIEDTFTVAFTTTFIECRERAGENEAWTMAGSLFSVLLLGCAFLALALHILAPAIVVVLAPGLPEEALALAAELVQALSPLVLISTLIALIVSIFCANQRFGLPAVTSLLPILGSVLFLLLFSDRIGVMAVPWGLVSFSALQLAALLVCLGLRGKSLFKLDCRLYERAKTVGRFMIPNFVNASLIEFDLMVDRFFASLLGMGYVTAITYSGKIPWLISGILMGSIGKSLMPHISALSARGDTEGLAGVVKKVVKIIALVLAPVCAFLLVCHEEIIRVLFQRGAFTESATILTAYPLMFFSSGLIFYGLNALLRGTFFALKDTLTPLKVSILGSGLNALLNPLLMPFLSHGGIALATTIVAVVSTGMLYSLLRKRLPSLRGVELCQESAKPLMAAIVMAFTLHYLRMPIQAESSKGGLAHLSGLFMVGALVYAGLCLLLYRRRSFSRPGSQEAH